MKQWYTAVGKLRLHREWDGTKLPAIVLNGEEVMLDIQEFLLWSALNWRIVSGRELPALYQDRLRETGTVFSRSLAACVSRMKQRGILAEGTGGTEEEALYDLLADLYVAPVPESVLLRFLAMLRFGYEGRLSRASVRQLFHRDRRNQEEKQVMRLSKQMLLSTAELVKCFHREKWSFCCEEEMLDTLYDDDDTTSYNIAEKAGKYPERREVLAAVANLYLRKQIILERIQLKAG